MSAVAMYALNSIHSKNSVSYNKAFKRALVWRLRKYAKIAP